MLARPAEAVNVTTLADVKHVSLVPPGTWQVDATRSTIGFEVRHLKLMHVHGCFHDVRASISCAGDGVATIAAIINVASIDTGDPRRDTRLCAEDFFDAEQHPTMSFMGQSHPVGASDALTVRGTMTMRALMHPFMLRAERGQAQYSDGTGEVRVRAHSHLSRREFGLNWDSAFAAGGLVIDDRVTLSLDVVLVRGT